MVKGKIEYRVCYADTDKMGYMYYGHYPRLYEMARVELMRELGVSYKSLEDKGIGMPVLENYSKYYKPALYDDILKIEVYIEEKPSLKISFNYKVFNQNEELLNEGFTKLVFMDYLTRKPIRPPKEIELALGNYFK